MSLNSVRFACTSLAGVNKAGNLKKDAQGYREVVVGALNVYNSAGQYYVYEQAKELFESSSQLMRRVSRGALRGENGHPKLLPGMSMDAFAHRCLSIWESEVCCHFREITLDFERVKDASGKPVIAIIAWVKGSGPHGPALERSLDNPNENVCFSIRAFTDDYRDRGIEKRVLRNIVTWDYVNEPGIAVAEKFKAPSLESMLDMQFSRGEIERGAQAAKAVGLAHESTLLSTSDLFQSLGWDARPDVSNKPSYMKW